MKRFILVLSLLLATWSSGASSNTHKLSLTERISYQKAIEEIFWKHTLWPNPQPKPLLQMVMSDSEIRDKVQQYLSKSAALEAYRQREISGDQLQTEMDRMAKETLDPELLREIFTALKNDPYLIAECFARPLVVDHLAQQIKDFDRSWKKQRSHFLTFTESAPYRYRLPEIQNALTTQQIQAANSWKATTTTGAPVERQTHVAVWTGTQMLIWGGWNAVYHGDGGRYSPATNSWSPISNTGAPAARAGHTGVWTGTELVVFGGFDNDNVFNSGGRYNPATDSWRETTRNGAPAARYYHTAIWTGTKMIVWGGGGTKNASVLKTGGLYDPATDSWTATKKTGAPLPRAVHTAVWTGSEMIVWGGIKYVVGGGGTPLDTGGRYNPATNSWSPTTTKNAPYQRTNHTAVWTGNEMIIYGGSSNTIIEEGGRYDPDTNSWSTLSTVNAASPRLVATAIWTGTQMIIWGGSFGKPLKTGGRYNPVNDTWSATKLSGAPAGRSSHTAVWTGTVMIVWGGYSTKDLKTGGVYTP